MPARTQEEANAQQRRYYQRNRVAVLAKLRAGQKRVREWFVAYRADLRCPCGEDDPRCLDFHHRDPDTKSFGVAGFRGSALGPLQREIEKCDVLCANCHRKLHATFAGKCNGASEPHKLRD